MKKVLAFDIDQTLNIAKTPIPEEIAILLTECLNYFEICPISGQKFDQFLIQIVDRLIEVAEATPAQLRHLHLLWRKGHNIIDTNRWQTEMTEKNMTLKTGS